MRGTKSAILFDFDYTLADSSRGAVACIEYALNEMVEDIPSWDACTRTIGLSLPETYKSLTGNDSPDRAATFSRLFIARADQIMAPNTVLYEGVTGLVERLRARGVRLGILSTKFRYRILQILERYSLEDRFDAIIGAEDCRDQTPDPEGFGLFLERLGVSANEVLLVGDSLVDAETARRGGVDFVAVLTGTTTAEQFAPYAPSTILESVVEVEAHTG